MSPLLGPDGQPLPPSQKGAAQRPEARDEHAEHGAHAQGDADADAERHLPQASFSLHVFHLASQVGIALGETENPMTGQRESDLAVARFLIDTLAMLEEKTRNNRTPEEEEYIRGVLTNLRMAFVAKAR